MRPVRAGNAEFEVVAARGGPRTMRFFGTLVALAVGFACPRSALAQAQPERTSPRRIQENERPRKEQPPRLQRLAPIPLQQQIQVLPRQRRALLQPASSSGIVLSRDADAERWLSKARAAAERQEWKLAVDTLWRVLDQYGRAVVSLDDEQMLSAADAAWQLLASWPDEALQTYRILYEPEAARLLRDAARDHDLAGLRLVTRKYLLTEAGTAALDLIATLALDEGRPAEAAAALRRLIDLSHAPPAAPMLKLRLAVAEAAAARRDRAEALLAELEAGLEGDEAPPLPPDWPDRIATVTAFIHSVQAPAAHESPDQWPGLLGGGDRRGRMAPVSPSVEVETPWRVMLPGNDQISENNAVDVFERFGVGPTWQCVADRSRIYVRCASGIAAIDASTFELAWLASMRPWERAAPRAPGSVPLIRRSDVMPAGDDRDLLDLPSLRAVGDELNGSLALIDGMLFAIEAPLEAEQGAAVIQQLGGQNWAVFEPFSNELIGNTLHAYDASTGKALWSKGVGGPALDALAEAHFFAPPVKCGGRLVAPYAFGNDFALAVIAPDGTLLDKIVIGHAPSEAYPRRAILQPTVSETTVFVPTGAGALLALSADDLALKWSATYERNVDGSGRSAVLQRDRRGTLIPVQTAVPAGWASNPPIVTDTLVLLAPPDSDYLLAFDRSTGTPRWTAPRDEHRYLIGCDAEHVFISGTAIRAVHLADGRRAWVRSRLRPTGRSALSGDSILVPTTRGLVVLDARTGDVRSEPPAGGLPSRTLGNLLAWDNVLINLTATALECLPDIPRSVAAAEALLASRRDDRTALLRLATLESLRGNLRNAIELLARARSATPAADERDAAWLTDQLTHLWVTAHLELAAEADDAERSALLKTAASAARRAQDVLRAELAVLALEAEGGDGLHAFRHGLRLLEQIGDRIVEIEPGLVGPAWIAIHERLERLWGEMTESDLRECVAATEDVLRAAQSDEQRIRLADALHFSDTGAWLDLSIGDQLAAAASVESAEFHFRRVLAAHADDANLSVPAMTRLVMLFLDPPTGIATRPQQAAPLLATLHDRYPNHALNPPIGGANSTNEFVAAWSARLPGRSIEAFMHAARAPRDYALWSVEDDRSNARRLPLGRLTATPDSLDSPSDLAILASSGQFVGLDVSDANPRSQRWACDYEDSPLAYAVVQRLAFGRGPPPRPTGAVEAAAAFLPVEGISYQVGTPSGRMLGPPLIERVNEDFRPEPHVASAGGYFVIAIDSHTLAGVPARENDGPLWTRDLGSFTIGALLSAEDAVVAIANTQRSALVIKPTTGRIRARLQLGATAPSVYDRPTEDHEPSPCPPAVLEGIICHTDGAHVAGSHLLSGRTLWRSEFDEPVRHLQALDSRRLGVTWGEANYSVLHATTGKPLLSVRLDDEVLPPLSASAQQGRLFLVLRSAAQSDLSRLASFDLESGSEIWSRGPMQRSTITNSFLRAAHDVIPIVEVLQVEAAAPTGVPQVPGMIQPVSRTSYSRIVLVDKLTGGRRGRPISLRGTRLLPESTVIDILFYPLRMIVITNQGYYIVGPEPASVAEPDALPPDEGDVP